MLEMKTRGNGQAKILSNEELKKIFNAFECERDRVLFAICLFTGCRISEALQLEHTDVTGESIVFRKSTTKGKLKTRTVALHPQLEELLATYKPVTPQLFPAAHRGCKNPYMSRGSADRIFRGACERAGVIGASTHSFRRTALTIMSKSGVPIRHIQEISGHGDLGTLQRYLEVTPDEVKAAISTIRL